MTDEMTIQQRKSPLVPTVLGAAAGAGGGALVGHWMTKPMTHDDIIKDINDTTTFSNRVKEGAPEAATWQEVKNKADEVAKLKGALEEAKLGELADKGLADDIARTEKEIEDKIANLTKEKTVTRGATERKILELSDNWRMTSNEKTEYTNLYNAYNDVTSKINTDSKVTPLIEKTNKRKEALEDTFKSIADDYANAVEKSQHYDVKVTNVDDYFSLNKKENKIFKQLRKWLKNDKSYESKFDDLVTSSKLAELTELDYQDLAKKAEKRCKDASGKIKDGFKEYEFDGKKYICKEEAVENLTKSKKEQVEKYFKEKLSKYIEYMKESNNIEENIRNSIKDKSVVKNAGLKYTDGKVENLLTSVREYADNLTTLNSDYEILKKAGLETNVKISSGTTLNKEITDIMAKYKVDQPYKAADIINARRNLANKYLDEVTRVDGLLKNIVEADSDLPKLQKMLSQAENSVKVEVEIFDKTSGKFVKKELTRNQLESTIGSRYGHLYPTQTVKTETVAGLTREQAIEKLGRTYTDLDDKLKGLKEKAKTAERKAANPEKIKKAQDAFDAGEKSLKEMAESLGKKMTKGPNKWVAAGIGAAVLGLATLLAVNSKNNKAQA